LIVDTVIIDQRYNGPPRSANGGWAGGLLASRLSPETASTAKQAFPSVSVSLKLPPPLNESLQVRRNLDASLTLMHGALELAHAQLEAFDLTPPQAPSLRAAEMASELGMSQGLSRTNWPYALCFACGVSRDDGLCISPSPLGGNDEDRAVGALWTPSAWLARDDGKVRLEAVWAALDCPAGIAWSYQLPEGALMVTVRMSVSVRQLPLINQPHIVLGWPISRDGRKLHAGTALYDAKGALLASSKQLWLLPKSSEL
jgi:hypothetical protein